MITLKFYPDPNDDDLYEIREHVSHFSWIIERVKEALDRAGFTLDSILDGSRGESCFYEISLNNIQIKNLQEELEKQDCVYSVVKRMFSYQNNAGVLVYNPGFLVRLG